MGQTNTTRTTSSNPLRALRRLAPGKVVDFESALVLAERQADLLLAHYGVTAPPVPIEVVSRLPHIAVQLADLPTSGVSFWHDQRWVLRINRREPLPRRRLTVFHEFKHIIDHGQAQHLYRAAPDLSAEQQAERAADYFAGCALLPAHLLLDACADGIREVPDLAALFLASERAVAVRLQQLSLNAPPLLTTPGSTYSQPALQASPHRSPVQFNGEPDERQAS